MESYAKPSPAEAKKAEAIKAEMRDINRFIGAELAPALIGSRPCEPLSLQSTMTPEEFEAKQRDALDEAEKEQGEVAKHYVKLCSLVTAAQVLNCKINSARALKRYREETDQMRDDWKMAMKPNHKTAAERLRDGLNAINEREAKRVRRDVQGAEFIEP